MTPEQVLKYLETNHQIHHKIKDSLVIVDYDHISADKTCPLVRECRGLVLEYPSLELVSRSFSRFLNAGENRDDDRSFDWSCPVYCQEKRDGSLIQLFNYNGEWRVTTRFSFADSLVNESPFTWTDLFYLAFPREYLDLLEPDYSYTFELESPYNRVVRWTDKPTVHLLSVFNQETELTHDAVDSIANDFNLLRPKTYKINDIFDAQRTLTEICIDDHTYEGFVVRDVHNRRLKIKSSKYILLHKQISNNGFKDVDLFRIFLDDGGSEWLTYFPELRPKIIEIGERFFDFRNKVLNEFNSLQSESLSQKEYALRVVKLPYSSLMFQLRRGYDFTAYMKDNLDRSVKWLMNQ